MFLFSNHQGSACFLAGECAQQNWTLQRQEGMIRERQEGMIRVLQRGKGTPHTMLLVLKKSPCRLETAVCTHTHVESKRQASYFSVLHLTPRMSVVFISFLPVSVYPSFIPTSTYPRILESVHSSFSVLSELIQSG